MIHPAVYGRFSAAWHYFGRAVQILRVLAAQDLFIFFYFFFGSRYSASYCSSSTHTGVESSLLLAAKFDPGTYMLTCL